MNRSRIPHWQFARHAPKNPCDSSIPLIPLPFAAGLGTLTDAEGAMIPRFARKEKSVQFQFERQPRVDAVRIIEAR
jgi:hypothetical protein